MSKSRRTRAGQLLGAAALTATAVVASAGVAQAAPSGAHSSTNSQSGPTSDRTTPLLADLGDGDTGLLVVYSGLLVAAGGGALWALRRNQGATEH